MSTEEYDNKEFVKEQYSCVTSPLRQMAIRELQASASSLRFWTGLAAVVLVLAIAAPFGTDAHFDFPTLLVYWGAIAVSTFFLAMITSIIVSGWTRQHGLSDRLSALFGGLSAGPPVTFLVVLFNRFFFDIDPLADHQLSEFTLQCTSITLATFTLFHLVERRSVVGSPTKPIPHPMAGNSEFSSSVESSKLNPLPALHLTLPRTAMHRRLPSRLGMDVVSLQAQDHYVDVTTTKGHELVLMRLNDAEDAMEGLPGMRVHRSWWVAESHMSAIRREGHRMLLILDTGMEVPISRSRVAALRRSIALRQA